MNLGSNFTIHSFREVVRYENYRLDSAFSECHQLKKQKKLAHEKFDALSEKINRLKKELTEIKKSFEESHVEFNEISSLANACFQKIQNTSKEITAIERQIQKKRKVFNVMASNDYSKKSLLTFFLALQATSVVSESIGPLAPQAFGKNLFENEGRVPSEDQVSLEPTSGITPPLILPMTPISSYVILPSTYLAAEVTTAYDLGMVESPSSLFCQQIPLSELLTIVAARTTLQPRKILEQLNLPIDDVSEWEILIKELFLGPSVFTQLADFAQLVVEMVKIDPSYQHLLKLKDTSSGGPLLWAAIVGKSALINDLKSLGLEVNDRSHSTGKSLLHSYFSNQQFSTLLAAGADPNIQDKKGRTPLHYVAENGVKHLLEMLLAAGSDPNVKDNEGNTPLHEAVKEFHWSSVEILLNAGARIDIKNFRGFTALNMAAKSKSGDILFKKMGIEPLKDLKFPAEKEDPSIFSRMHVFLAFSKSPLSILSSSFYRVKYFSHSWELGGESIVQGMMINNEGFYPFFTARYMSSSMESFRQQYPEIAKDKLDNVIEALTDSTSFFISNANLLKKYREGKPIIINIVSRVDKEIMGINLPDGGHAISIVLQGSNLMICNKGLKTSKPVEAYEIDPSLITEEILSEIQAISDMRTNIDQFYAAFSNQHQKTINPGSLLTKLKARDDTLKCKWIETLIHEKLTQSVGNCAWESVETAAYVAMAMPFFSEGSKGHEEAYGLFDSWRQFTKLKTLNTYIEEELEWPLSNIEWSSHAKNLMNIFKKANSIPWRLDFRKKIEEIHAQAIDIKSLEDARRKGMEGVIFRIYNWAFGGT